MNDDWTETTLGDCCDFVSEKVSPTTVPLGTPYVGLEHIESNIGRISSAGNPSQVTSAVAQFHSGDTLFGRLRPYLHKVAYADFSGVCSPEVLVLRARKDVIDAGFLFLAGSSSNAIDHAVALSAGSRMPRTSASDLSSFPISLPPLPVQRRIVDLMAHLDNQIANVRTERDAGRGLRKATLSNLLDATREIPADYDAAFDLAASAQQASPTSDQAMNDDWRQVPLHELARVDRGASWSKAQEVTDGTGSPVIRIANVQPSGLDLKEVRSVVGMKVRDIERAQIGPHTLLMVGSNGNPERVGNVYQSDSNIEGMSLASFLVGIHSSDELTSKWLYYFLSSDHVQYLLTEATAGSTGLKNLSLEWLRRLEISLPPLPVQRRIVDLIAHLDNQIAGIDVEVSTLESLRRQLLASLLSQGVELPASYDLLLDGVA